MLTTITIMNKTIAPSHQRKGSKSQSAEKVASLKTSSVVIMMPMSILPETTKKVTGIVRASSFIKFIMGLLRLGGFVGGLVSFDDESVGKIVAHDFHNFLNAFEQEAVATMGTSCSIGLTDRHVVNVAKIDPADLFTDCTSYLGNSVHQDELCLSLSQEAKSYRTVCGTL